MFYTYYVKAENKYYFGSRTPEFMLNQDAKDDFMIKYFTSTTDERLREIIRNKEYEKAEIIKEYTDRQECLKDEELLIENFWWLYGRLNCWNRQANGKFSMSGTHQSEETRQKHSEAYNNMSDEKKAEINKKISERVKEAFNNMSDEKKAERRKNISDTKNNKSDEEKEEISKKKSEAFNNMSDEKKAERRKNISEAKKGKKRSDKTKEKISETLKGKPKPKFYWRTPSGEIKTMSKCNAVNHHPDYVYLGPADTL